MALAWPAYRAGIEFGPGAFFAVNAVVVLAVLIVAAWAFVSLLPRGRALLVALGVAAALCWPYTLELFFFPSLQEKGVILAAACYFLWLRYAPGWHPLVRWSVLVLVLAAAATSKTHIVVFVPALLAATYVCARRPGGPARGDAIAAGVGLVVVASVTTVLTVTGDYSRQTRGTVRLSAVVGDRRLVLLGLVTVLFVVLLAVRHRRGRGDAIEWVPAILLVTMCAAFAVWSIRNYYLAVAGPMIGFAVTVVAGWCTRIRTVTVIAVAAAVAAVGVVLVRLPDVLGPLGSIRALLAAPVSGRLSDEQAEIAVSCAEAPTHFTRYADWLGRPGLRFVAGTRTADPALVWADTRLCPWPAGPAWHPLWSDPGGWTLYATGKG